MTSKAWRRIASSLISLSRKIADRLALVVCLVQAAAWVLLGTVGTQADFNLEVNDLILDTVNVQDPFEWIQLQGDFPAFEVSTPRISIFYSIPQNLVVEAINAPLVYYVDDVSISMVRARNEQLSDKRTVSNALVVLLALESGQNLSITSTLSFAFDDKPRSYLRQSWAMVASKYWAVTCGSPRHHHCLLPWHSPQQRR